MPAVVGRLRKLPVNTEAAIQFDELNPRTDTHLHLFWLLRRVVCFLLYLFANGGQTSHGSVEVRRSVRRSGHWVDSQAAWPTFRDRQEVAMSCTTLLVFFLSAGMSIVQGVRLSIYILLARD